MSIRIFSALINPLRLTANFSEISALGTTSQHRHRTRYPHTPKKKHPPWLLKQIRVKYEENLTPENEEFIQEVIQAKYGHQDSIGDIQTFMYTPLRQEPIVKGVWKPNARRCGLIAQKIGCVPQYLKDGTCIMTTMLQVIDNHVVKYIAPEDYNPPDVRHRRYRYRGNMGCLVVGAINSDPQLFTKPYCGLFNNSGVMPKKILTRFPISPQAAIQPGTPLFAAHFKVGDVVDVKGFTVDRGFQGVMKRWKFKGGRATHGVTKNHRRPGSVGSGRDKARVWPGKKLPGHMGNRARVAKGLTVWRINHKHNVLYVMGQAIPGNVNSFVQIFDTLLWKRRRTECPNFPTYFPEEHEKDPLPEEEYHPKLFNFDDPTIEYEPEVAVKKKK